MCTMKKVDEQVSAIMTLPLGLLQRIFLRLPVKFLILLKCVSKEWYILISDPFFAKLHYDVAIAPTNNNNIKLLYLSIDRSKACCVKIKPSMHHDYPFKLPETYKNKSTRIIGSCRGFILLQIDKPEPVLILWNPATSSRVQVPYPKKFWRVSCSFCDGVAYEKSSDDYLVIIGSFQRRAKWHFFSVRTNSWKEIEGGDNFSPDIAVHHQLGLLYNEAIHWLVIYYGSDYPQGFVIAAFDVATKTLSVIPLPRPQNPHKLESSLIGGGGGGFGICMMDVFKAEIWMMKEYKVQSSWTKLNIHINIICPSDRYDMVIPLCFTESENEILCRMSGIFFQDLVKFRSNRVLEYFSLDFCFEKSVLVMFNESLLSLPSSCGQEE